MARNVQILLLETVESTGIVGDVVNVRKGFARNYLLPRGLAETPSEAKIKDLQGKRKEAIKHLAELRKSREALVEKLSGHELTMIRSCNDLGILYAAVTQHEIAVELEKAGFKGIVDREVRLGQPIKRVGDYPVTIKFQLQAVPDEEITKTKPKAGKKEENAPLEAEIKLHVKPDRELNTGRRDRDEEAKPEGEAGAAAEGAEGAEGGEKRTKDKSAKFDTAKPGQKKDEAAPAEKAAKAPKAEKADKGEKKAEKKK